MRSRSGAALGAMVMVTTALAVATPAAAAPGGFDATCVTTVGPSGPVTSHRQFSVSARAPDSVAAGAPFTVSTDVGYAVPPNASVSGAFYDATRGEPAQSYVTADPGDPSIQGGFRLTAAGPVGTAVVVSLREFGAFANVGSSTIAELCHPDHTLVVARVGIGVPQVSIGDAAVVEGASGTRALGFAVSLSRPTATNVTVPFATEDAGATAGPDYVAGAGTVTIPAGSVTGSAVVRVRGDAVVESKENFRVRLRDPVGATLGRAVGTGRIIDDDPEPGPRISIGDAGVVEGARGTRSARFTVSLSAPAATPVSVHVTTVAGSAQAGSDYRVTDVVLGFGPGETSESVPVAVVPDGVAEGTETFSVQLSEVTGAVIGRHNGVGAILDDD